METLTLPTEATVSSTEAAFIAALAPKEMHRVVDESVFPEELIVRSTAPRRFARLGAVFARFYFETASTLSKTLRTKIIYKLVKRIRQRDDASLIFGLAAPVMSLDWSVRTEYVTVDLQSALKHVTERALRVENALRLVVENPDILGGRPTFHGTRVPIDVALNASLSGEAWKRLVASYPFLTKDHVDAANVYSIIHPRRGRPVKSEAAESAWKVKSARRIPPVHT